MANLGIPRNTIEVLQRHNFTFQKKYGQNFLIDPNVLERVIGAAEVSKEDCVLEIGPGIGCLTQELCRCAGKVVSVELDHALLPVLEETMDGAENFTLISGDILKLDIPALADQHFQGLTPMVCANLPYNINTPVLTALVDPHGGVDKGKLLRQLHRRPGAVQIAAGVENQLHPLLRHGGQELQPVGVEGPGVVVGVGVE